MKRRYKQKSKEQVKTVKDIVQQLFDHASDVFKENPVISDKFVKMARETAMKYRVRLSPEQRKQFCKHCYCFLKPSKNCRVRLVKSKVVYYCNNCKKFMRFPYIKEQKLKRKKL